MRILLSGASGFLGSELKKHLEKNQEVLTLVRSTPKNSKEIFWNISSGKLNLKSIEKIDGVLHLAGENIGKRWSKKIKNRILESRIEGTKLLAEKLSQLPNPPKFLCSASAIGYYGYQRNSSVDETSKQGDGFLANLCSEWEKATLVAKKSGIRVVHLRIGVVLGSKGGVLPKMALPFKLALGGKIGHGKQMFSWISISDLRRAILYCIQNEKIEGPVNLTSPSPVSNSMFTKTLGEILKRPTLVTIPSFIIKVLLGEMGKETILSNLEVYPKVLMKNGFKFDYSDLKEALNFELNR